MSLNVICPNRHRVTVKVEAGTTLFQVLEEACKKQGFVADDHALKHHSTLVDLSLTFRLSGLPQNCTLEIVECTVTGNQQLEIALQLPDGQRLTKKIPADATLIDMLLDFETLSGSKLVEPDDEEDMQPICNYLNREYIGTTSLSATTLKSLGIRDRALFRYTRRKISKEEMTKINESVDQNCAKQRKLDAVFEKKLRDNKVEDEKSSATSVISAAQPTQQQQQVMMENFGYQQRPQQQQQQNLSGSRTDEEAALLHKLAVGSATVSPNVITIGSGGNPGGVGGDNFDRPISASGATSDGSTNHRSHSTTPSQQPIRNVAAPAPGGVGGGRERSNERRDPSPTAPRPEMFQKMLDNVNSSMMDASSDHHEAPQSSGGHSKSTVQQRIKIVDFSNFKFPENTKGMDLRSDQGNSRTEMVEPCDRRPVVYRIDDKLNIGIVEPPPEFYEVSVDDVKLQLSRLREQSAIYGQLSMMPEAFIREKDTQERRKAWKFSIIRVQFVDGTILQGTFKSLEKISALYHFVQSQLANDKIAFDLIAPPNVRLHKMEQNFIDAGIAPRALLIFKCRKEDAEQLKTCLTNMARSPNRKSQAEAELTAHECLLQNDRYVPYTTPVPPGGSNVQNHVADDRSKSVTPKPATSTNSQLPKWLKK